jgi:S1-C subfamily serine protease
LTVFLSGCTGFTIEFTFTTTMPTTTQATTTSLTTSIDGTLTISEDDYNAFPFYNSPTFGLTNIAEYNDILLQSRDKGRRANVEIKTTIYRMVPLFPGSRTMVEQIVGTSSGSGVVYKSDETHYYAITNYHVVEPEGYTARYEVSTFDTSTVSAATLVAYNEDYDLAVVKFVKTSHPNVQTVNVTKRAFTKINPGELVLAVGNPQTITYNVTFGEFVRMAGIANASFKVVYHTAMIHEGSSGGALLDVDGNLVGINTWGSSSSDQDSFAVPLYIVYMFLFNQDLL